jgi:hypothetical protein
MRLSDSGLRRRKTKLLYPNHRLPLGSSKTRPRDRSNRLLGARQVPLKKVVSECAPYERAPRSIRPHKSKFRPATVIR